MPLADLLKAIRADASAYQWHRQIDKALAEVAAVRGAERRTKEQHEAGTRIGLDCGRIVDGGPSAAARQAGISAGGANPLAEHTCPWKEAIIDACVVGWIFTKEHESDPRKAVNDLLCWEAKCALDPAISEDACRLIQQGAECRWLPIDEHDGSRDGVLVSVDGMVGEANYHHDEGGWWWANNDPTDVWGGQIYPTHFRPMPDPPRLTPPSAEERT